MPRRNRLIATVLVLWVVSLSAQEPKPKFSLDMPAARWQLLPEAVRAVYVGPDGRRWHQLNGDALGRSDSQIRNSLEVEFKKPAPLISGAAIALLEPSGRVWFSVKSGREIWGFDGNKWIDRQAFTGANFIGSCPTRGELPDNEANCCAGRKVFFRDRQGIHVFDGEQWTYNAICSNTRTQNGLVRYAVSPSGKHAVAFVPLIGGPSNQQLSVELWVFDENKWKKRKTPWPSDTRAVGSFCVTDDGLLWYMLKDGRLKSCPLPGDADPTPPNISTLIAQLDHDDFQSRQRSFELLAELGEVARPELQRAIKAAKSVELRLQLEALLGRLSANSGRIVSNDIRLGQCRVGSVSSVYQDELGKLYVFAAAITTDGGPTVSGLALVDETGKSRVYPLVSDHGAFFWIVNSGRSPIRTAKGEALWFSGSMLEGLIRRLDLNTSQLTEDSPDSRFGFIQSVDDSGRVYLGRRLPSVFGTVTRGVGQFCPDVAESRAVLLTKSEPVRHPVVTVAPDGAVWAFRAEQGLSRFDGLAWESIHPEAKGYCEPVLFGRANVVIGRLNNNYVLFKDNKVVATGLLRNLVEMHPEMFVAAFPPEYTQPQRQLRISIASDAKGNIWTVESRRLSILSAGKWIEAAESLKAPGSRDGGVVFVSAVGDGHKVYVMPSQQSKLQRTSFLAELQDGQIQLTEAPEGAADVRALLGLRDGTGALWVPDTIQDRKETYSIVKAFRAFRITGEGQPQEFTKEGWPFLVDRSENVWLVETNPSSLISRLSIWRKDKVIQRIEVSGADTVYGLFSDKPNSVYVWTSLGLHHFVVDETDERGLFAAQGEYALPKMSLTGNEWEWAYSNLAGFVVCTSLGHQRQLTFIRLPGN